MLHLHKRNRHIHTYQQTSECFFRVSALKLDFGVGHTEASGLTAAALVLGPAMLGGWTWRMDPGPMPSGTTMLKLEPSIGFFLNGQHQGVWIFYQKTGQQQFLETHSSRVVVAG